MMKKLLTTLFFLGAVSFAFAQTVYYSEDFNSGLPADWAQDSDDWVIGTPAIASSQFFTVPDADGNVVCWNDDALGQVNGGGTITSGEIDLSAVSGDAILEFRSYFPNLDYQDNDETAKVYVSTDGTNFDLLVDLTGGEGATFGVGFADVSAYVGGSIWLNFEYVDGDTWNYGWAFDDVQISSEITLIDAKSWKLHAGGSIEMDEALEGVEYKNSGYIVNLGLEEITSYDVTLSDGTNNITQSFTGVSIPYNATVRYSMDEAITVSGNTEWTATISNVNGSMDPDADASDNSMSFNLNAVSNVDPNKAVAVEEATGTWCQFCPRGAVFLDEMSKRFGKHFVGVAVHNGQNDPMVLNAYDNAITSFPGFTGFPQVIYQRESVMDPADIVSPSLSDMQTAPPAKLQIGATMDGSTLVTSIEVEFLEDVEADYKVAIVLTEDGMSGIGGGWNQINAYAGGAGTMGGYEILPGSVPGELMVYDHVGRALIGGFDGVPNIITGAYVTGNVAGHIFESYNVSAEINMDNVHIVGFLINSSGEIVNAIASNLEDAVDNGLYAPVSTNVVYDNTLAEVFPNPVREATTIYMSVAEASDVTVSLVNAVGQTLSVKNYGVLSGDIQLNYDMKDVNEGMYILRVQADDKFMTKKITKVN